MSLVLLFPSSAASGQTLTPSGIASAEAFGSPALNVSYSYRRAITIDRTKVAAAQSDFPVLIAGTWAALATVANGGRVQSSSGYDIAFYADAAGATKLDYERVSWDASTGKVEFWVRIPSLATATDTVIYLHYGNSSVTTDGSNKTGVWDTNYAAVYHLDAPGGTLSAADSTANGRNGTVTGATSGTGKAGGAASFASGNKIQIAGLIGSPSSITIAGWGSLSTVGSLGSEFISIGDAVAIRLDDKNAAASTLKSNAFYHTSSGWSSIGSGSNYAGTGWHHFAYTATAGSQVLYVDGAAVASDTVANAISYSGVGSNTFIASHANGDSNYPFTGLIDEVRISSAVRSASWIATEYASVNDPAFLSVGSEQSTAPGTTVSPTGVASAEAFGAVTLTAAVTLAQTGIASAEAFGATTLTSAVTFATTGISTAEAFGSLTLAPGTATLSQAGIATAETFGAVTRTASVTLSQTGIASAEAFGSPSASSDAITLSTTGISTAEAFGAPTLASGAGTLLPAGVASAEAFGAPAFTSAVTLSLAGIASSEALGAPVLSGNRPLALTAVPSGEAFGAATTIQNGFLTPTAIASAEAFGTGSITTAVTLPLSSVASAEAFGSFTVSPSFTLGVAGIVSAEAFGAEPIVSRPLFFAIAGIPSAETIFAPRILPRRPQRVTTFFNGQVLTTMALTPQAINVTLQTLTCRLLGTDPATDANAYAKVRLDWPTTGQPGWSVDEDVCFLKAVEEDNAYNQIRDRRYVNNNPASLHSIDSYTRVWRVSWSFYGPTSYDNARLLKSALLSFDYASETLADMGLYLNTEIGAPLRSPEKFQSQWWERVDLSVTLNELVTESLTVDRIASAEVILIDNDRGQVADITT